MAENFKQSYMRDAFIEGASWQRNSIWHDASEIPEDKSECMVISKRGNKDILTYSNNFFCIGCFIKFSSLAYVDKWCYLSEILPTKD